MKARDIMTTHPSVVTPDDALCVAAKMMKDRNIGMLPVIDNLQHRHLEGILTDRDIAVRCVARGHGPACTVREHMTAGHLNWVHLDSDLSEVVRKMEQNHVRRIPVLTDDGRVSGVIALADLAMRLRPHDPELVEEVQRRIYGSVAVAF